MTCPLGGNRGRRCAPTVLAAFALLAVAGCASLSAPSHTADARSAGERSPPRAALPRTALPSAPFGDLAGEPPPTSTGAGAAKPDTAGSGVRPTAWSKLKGVISRTPPAAIPLPAPSDKPTERDSPESNSDARDF